MRKFPHTQAEKDRIRATRRRRAALKRSGASPEELRASTRELQSLGLKRAWHEEGKMTGTLEAVRSKESREKQAAKLRGRKQAPEHVAKMRAALTGKKRSEEVCAKARGRKHSAAWSAAQAAGMTKAWEDPSKFTNNRHQTKERIETRIGPIRGKPLSPEHREKIAAKNRGKKLSPKHRAASSKNWLNIGGRKISDESEKKRAASISKQRIGTHGYGRSARGRLDHTKAKHWEVRDPNGVIHAFDNLNAWSRANEHRFLPDEFPDAKMPLWLRFSAGISQLRRTDDKACHHYKGWTLVSLLEHSLSGTPDLLARIREGSDQPQNDT